MKGLIQEYGLILVGVAAILICLLFGKQIFQHDIKDATVSNIAKLTQNNDSFNGYVPGTTLSVEGHEVIVLEKKDDEKYLVMEKKSIGNIQFQPNQDSSGNYIELGKYNSSVNKTRVSDGKYSNTYEGSYIDDYLENNWYQNLSKKMKEAIVLNTIRQNIYYRKGNAKEWKVINDIWYYNEGTEDSPSLVLYDKAKIKDSSSGAYPYRNFIKRTSGYENVTFPIIQRHVFVPSIEEFNTIVAMNNANKTREFLKIDKRLWTRDIQNDNYNYALDLSYAIAGFSIDYVTNPGLGVRPTYVLDTSKVDVDVTGVSNYK